MGSDNIESRTFYEILGVDRRAIDSDLDDAFEARLDACDELDQNPEEDGLTQNDVKKIREHIIRAYKTLRNPAQRAAYDGQIFGEIKNTAIEVSDDAFSPNYSIPSKVPVQSEVTFVTREEPEQVKEQKIKTQDLIVSIVPEPAASQERSRRFTEFPAFPNMMEAQEAAAPNIPQGRLKKTTSLPADAVEALTEAARQEVSYDSPELHTNQASQEAPPKTAFITSGSEQPTSLNQLADDYNTEQKLARTDYGETQDRKHAPQKEQPQKQHTKTISEHLVKPPLRPSMEMPRSYVNEMTRHSSSEKKPLDYLLIFCAFVLPFGSLLFAITYFLLN